MDIPTSRVLLLVAGVPGVAVGWAAVRQMDDHPDVPVLREAWNSIRRRTR